MSQRYHFIVNPKSGSSLDVATVQRLRDHLCAAGSHVQVDLTRSLEHARQLADHAVNEAATAIVVAGGDGTVRAVIEGTNRSGTPLVIIPCGTENLLACELGLDSSLRSCLGALADGVGRTVDLGCANGSHFMAIAGVGFDAEVIRRIERQRAGHIGHTDYLWPICRTYWEYSLPQLRVEADGQLLCDEPALVFVSNISRYAVQLGISPDADCGDGLLDVCVYRCRSRAELLLHAAQTALRTSGRNHRIERRRCRKLTISSCDPDVPVQLDGDPGPALPLQIEVLPAAARILTPRPAPGDRYHQPVRFYHLRQWLNG